MVDVQETKNALWRREEQLRRWNQSDTNKESPEPRKCDNIKVKFEDSYVFLAACSSGDKEEVENLLKKGADINTANIDGLTALHQACIDDNLEMVQFLVEHGAAIDAADNEGWTALHATASCGFLDVARYLLEKGASIAAVNNDGELALDLAEGDDMEDLLQEDMDKQGIDADAAREEESKMMLNDANQWLTTKYDEQPHAKTGATSLHCAAAKGYCDVIEVLLQAGADIDAKDFDGWTPLQAAAHWGQEDACKLLVENFCNMEHANKSGQTVFDLVDPDLEDTLRQLKERQALLRQDKDLMKDLTTRGGGPALRRRSSVTRMSVDQKQNVNRSNVEEEREIMRNKVVEEDRKSSESSEAEETSSTAESSSDSETEKKNAINRQTSLSTKHQVNGAPISTTLPTATTTTTTGTPLTKDSDNDKPIRTVPESPAPKIEDSKEIKPPPPKPFAPPSSTIPTPRIQDLAKTERLQKEADKENEKLTERNSNRFSLLEKTDISKKVDVKKEDKREDKLAETEKDKDKSISNKPPLQRVISAPPKLTANTGNKQVPSFAPKPPPSRLETERVIDGPTSWRSGLRKTGSSSAVPETNTYLYRNKETDRLPRSASSSWLTNTDRNIDNSKGRPISALSGDSLETKNRFESSLRGTAVTSSSLAPTRNSGHSTLSSGSYSRDQPSSTASITGPLSAVGSTTTTTTSGPTSSSHSLSSYNYQPFVPLSRRGRLADADDSRKERHSVSGAVTSVTSPVTTTTTTGSSGRRSYAPPVRDEEKEVERKARARKARETRRSTQGVTREEIEAAEQTLKDADRKPNTESRTDDRSDKENKPDDTSSSLLRRKHDDKSSTDENSTYTRRSYRDSALTSDSYNIGPSYSRSLRASGPIGTSNNSISSTSTATTAAPSSGGSLHSLSSAVTAVSPTSSLTSTTSSSTSSSGLSTTSSTAPYRSSYRSKYMGSSCDTDDKKDIKTDDKSIKEKDKDTSVLDKDSPSLKSSAIRSRKKRESRRGTGKITLEDIQAAKTDGETEVKEKESAKEETSRYPSSSRFSDISSSSLYDTTGTSRYSSSRDRPSSYHSSSGYSRSQSSTSLPDKDIDYKRLYEEQKAENEKLRKDIKKAQQELSDTKLDLEKLRMKSEPSRGTETAAERKEKRTLERKISELEEELRQMENLKADNQRLKEENGALIRVISKLSK